MSRIHFDRKCLLEYKHVLNTGWIERPISVAVIGTGPAAMVAAYAAMLSNPHAQVFIYGPEIRSKIAGAQYLHGDIMDRPSDRSLIYNTYLGERDAYKEKVYPQGGDFSVSWDDIDQGLMGVWPMTGTYNRLWSFLRGHERVYWRPGLLGPVALPILRGQHDLVFNSAPKENFCVANPRHTFEGQPVWISVEDPEYPTAPPMTVVSSGRPEHKWYRASHLYGQAHLESSRAIFSHSFRIVKPLSNNCDCWDEAPFVQIGRNGKHQKGVLVTDVFYEVLKEIMDWQVLR